MRAGTIRVLTAAVVLVSLMLAAAPVSVAAAKPAVYEITIVNLTPGQPLGPHLIGVANSKKGVIVKNGKPASAGLATLTATDYLGDLYVAVDESKHFDTQAGRFEPAVAGGVAGAAVHPSWVRESMGPWDPGSGFFATVVSRLPCTNDGFAASKLIKLPRKIGQVSVAELYAFDAGTEQNSERFVDLSPNCEYWLAGEEGEPPAPAVAQPELPGEGAVGPHPGIAGTGDLDPEMHGWDGPVGLVMVKAVKP